MAKIRKLPKSRKNSNFLTVLNISKTLLKIRFRKFAGVLVVKQRIKCGFFSMIPAEITTAIFLVKRCLHGIFWYKICYFCVESSLLWINALITINFSQHFNSIRSPLFWKKMGHSRNLLWKIDSFSVGNTINLSISTQFFS